MGKCDQCELDGSMIESDGDYVCRLCGFVAEQGTLVMDQTPYSVESDGSDTRQHGPRSVMMRHDMGVSSEISMSVDGTGKRITGRMSQMFMRLRRQHAISSVPGPEKKIVYRLQAINSMGSAMGLSDTITEDAARICRKAVKEGLTKNMNVKIVAAACLYAVVKANGIPRSIREFGAAAGCKNRLILGAYSTLADRFGMTSAPVDLAACITRLANNAGISEKVKRDALRIIDEADVRGECAGKSPTGLAAGALYIACLRNGTDKTQRDLAEASGMTEVTIRNVTRAIDPKRMMRVAPPQRAR